MTLPMDEALVICALDCSGRPFFAWDIALPQSKVALDSELAEDFFRALAVNAGSRSTCACSRARIRTHHRSGIQSHRSCSARSSLD